MAKRTMSLFLLISVLLGLLAACGQTPATTQPGAGEPAATTAPPAEEAAEPTTAPAEAGAEPTAPPAEADEPTSAPAADSRAMLTVSREQQASWTRNFNPFLSEGTNRFPTQAGIYEPLMIFNTMTGEYVPWLATEYAWSKDNTTLTFTTRNGVQWSDGEYFTAEDVAFTFNYMRENEGIDLTGVWGFLDAVEATDDNTVVFTFERAFTPGLVYIAHQAIVPEHVWSAIENPAQYPNENPVGTGPFTEILTFQNQIYELGRNPNYWQADKPAIDGLRFPAFSSNEQAQLALVSGEVDWAGNFVPQIEQTYVAKDPEHHKYWFPPLGSEVMLYVNTTMAPFDNADVRKAISMAINREQIVTVAMQGYTKPADATGLSDAYESWKNEEALAQGDWVNLDVERANQILDEAGFARGADGIRTLPDGTPMSYNLNVVTGWSDWVSAVQIISQNLKEIGIDARVNTLDFGPWFEEVQNGTFEMSIGWSAGGPNAPTPYNFYRGQMSNETFKPVGETSGENWHRYVSARADELLAEFAATSDEAEQRQIADELQMVFVEEAPAIPLFPGPLWAEYSTARFDNWPTPDNPYAIPTPNNAPMYLLVLTSLQPK